MSRRANEANQDLILQRIEVSPAGCWEWTELRCNRGYGMVRIAQKWFRAHRMAMHVFKDFDLKSKLLVCHTCDNPPCVNPAHLFIGTPKDNARDAVRKGRWVNNAGERHPQLKLSTDDLWEIKRLYDSGSKQRELAKMYNVSQQHVSKIINSKSRRSELNEGATE